MPAWPPAWSAGLALVLAACAEGPRAPGTLGGTASDAASAGYWRTRIGECANVGDVLQRRKCIDTVERDRAQASAKAR